MIQLYDLRTQAGLSQKKLAAELNMSAGNLCDWEKGRTEPDIDKLIKLADYFDVSLDILVGRETPPVSDGELLAAKNRYRLLNAYEKLSPALQKRILELLEELTNE